jgi:hypothetical protein
MEWLGRDGSATPLELGEEHLPVVTTPLQRAQIWGLGARHSDVYIFTFVAVQVTLVLVSFGFTVQENQPCVARV